MARAASKKRALAFRAGLGKLLSVRFAHFAALRFAPSQVLAQFGREPLFAGHIVACIFTHVKCLGANATHHQPPLDFPRARDNSARLPVITAFWFAAVAQW